MRAVVYYRYGGPEVLEPAELAEPKLGPDSVLVRTRAAGVNPVDWKLRSGYLDTLIETHFPVVPGWDLAGVVERVGPDVTEYAPGDEVIGYVREDHVQRGTHAELVAAPVRTLARKPAGCSWAQAAGLPLAGLTAYQALGRGLGLAEGETLLVHAAAGGVGSLAVQIARARGARVIGTAGPANHDFLRGLGAEPVAYGEGLAERVRELAPGGVDAVLDSVGGETLEDSAGLLAASGRLVSIADPGVNGMGGRYVFVRPDTADLTALGALVDEGKLTVEVAATFPLERTADAQALSAEGHTRGKIVVELG
ncbi:NADPH:quinone reductase-like Zn-dependent oxidoreductase [Allonocardiopsis opalescens]|uniref:NADPH:quinone reductase-like Zn-dependent oxidoreductase n=2 Tax=Allonocardiopsis opalescens TaxID=1144618 RepID=A0A2T0Q0R9_9ACTN|nr:NADPH:quinone reductase-like Zn-dependent oxidoreductase [Allonocardiopsis opalescens]